MEMASGRMNLLASCTDGHSRVRESIPSQSITGLLGNSSELAAYALSISLHNELLRSKQLHFALTATASTTRLSSVAKREIEKFIIRQPPKGEKDDYDSENSWISDGLPSSSRRRRRGHGR